MSKHCKEFKKNPLINPETGRAIKKDGPTYKKLMKMCSESSYTSSVKPKSPTRVGKKVKLLKGVCLNNPDNYTWIVGKGCFTKSMSPNLKSNVLL